jgi:hypothetical protein
VLAVSESKPLHGNGGKTVHNNFLENRSVARKYNSVTGSRYADCHCYPTAGYIVSAAGVTEFPEICAVATQRKAGYEFHIRSND